MDGKTVLITGCGAHSLGEATAVALAQRGAKVLISTRQHAAERALAIAQLAGVAAAQVQGHDLDLLDARSTQAFTAWVQTQTPALDVLINNAGVHLDLLGDHKTPQLSADGHEIHWRCNYLGPAQLSLALLPLLLQTAAQKGQARVVNVCSMMHSKGKNRYFFTPQEQHDSWVSYGNSKLALMHFSRQLHALHHAQGLHTYSLHPGAVLTRVADKGLQERVWLAKIRKTFAPIEALFLLTPEEGAQTSLLCASAPDLPSGEYWRNCAPAPASSELQDSAAGERLWAETLQKTLQWQSSTPTSSATSF